VRIRKLIKEFGARPSLILKNIPVAIPNAFLKNKGG
jgi:hypothetical protein